MLTLFVLLPVSGQLNKTIRLKVIETSDVHGHFFPYDFMERKPLKGTLTRANTYIKRNARNMATTCCSSTTATSCKDSPVYTGRTT